MIKQTFKRFVVVVQAGDFPPKTVFEQLYNDVFYMTYNKFEDVITYDHKIRMINLSNWKGVFEGKIQFLTEVSAPDTVFWQLKNECRIRRGLYPKNKQPLPVEVKPLIVPPRKRARIAARPIRVFL